MRFPILDMKTSSTYLATLVDYFCQNLEPSVLFWTTDPWRFTVFFVFFIIHEKMELRQHLLAIVLLIFVHLKNFDCTLSKNDPKKPKSKSTFTIKVILPFLLYIGICFNRCFLVIAGNNWFFVPQVDPQEETVFERELVKVQTSAKEILSDYNAYSTKTNERRVDKTVLGYITPVSVFINYLKISLIMIIVIIVCSGMAMDMMWPKYLQTNLIWFLLFGCKLHPHLEEKAM